MTALLASGKAQTAAPVVRYPCPISLHYRTSCSIYKEMAVSRPLDRWKRAPGVDFPARLAAGSMDSGPWMAGPPTWIPGLRPSPCPTTSAERLDIAVLAQNGVDHRAARIPRPPAGAGAKSARRPVP